jgi:hypothetical protein
VVAIRLPENTKATAGNGGESQNIKASDLLLSSLTDGADIALEARRRRDQVKLLLTRMTEQTNMVGNILEEAQTNEDHLTLGYKSWTKYIVGEYAGELADLDRAQRREVVGSLTSAGMPTRAIAEIVGVDHSTVVRDQKQVVQGAPPDREDSVDRRVTGLDGKSYTVPSKPAVEPRKPRRSSLPDQYWNAIHDLDKVLRRVAKLHADDRFMANRKAIKDLHWCRLSDMEMLLGEIDMDLGGSHKCHVCDKRVPAGLDFGSTQTMCKSCAGESR